MSDSSSLALDPPSLPSTLTDLHLSEMQVEQVLPPGSVPFTDLAAHARGGLGDVFRGTDPDLNRTVALKCLQERHSENPDSRRRFLLEAEGRTIYISGDTCAFGEMAWIGESRELDLAFLPIGDNYTMGAAEAVRCLEMLRPALTVPVHYDTFPEIETGAEEFASLAAAAGFEVRVMRAGDRLEL